MPNYDFRCQKCSCIFEATLPFGSKKRPRCPECSSIKTEKLIVPPAVHFKGTGFFATDSRAKPPSEKKPKTTPETKKPAAPPAKESGNASAAN